VVIDWESFRGILLKHLDYRDQKKGGRIPWCPVLMFKVLVLQRFFGLGDEETEFQILDRFSFLRFLGLRPGDGSPDHSTIWAFKERLGVEGMEAVFAHFDAQLRALGLIGKAGKIIDASFVEAPRQRNTRAENDQIKQGERPESFDQKPCRGCQKDTDARWTKKNNETHYGYKNHVKVDAGSKFIEAFTTTDASVHDSQALDELIGETDQGSALWADSAYTGQPIAERLKDFAIQSMICLKGHANHPLSRRQKQANKQKSKIRARVEHVFGRQAQFGGDVLRRIGKQRARFENALTNLTYNIDRLARMLQPA